MLNIVLFGGPGSGKGTQSENLITKYGLKHLSTGDIFRFNIKNETELGVLAKSYMDKGNLVPDEVTIKMLEAEVDKNTAAKGFIFDGFPRTTVQAAALDAFLNKKGTSITCMLELDVANDELIKRLLLRGADSGRADDKDEKIIKNRIDVYFEQTAVVADFYAQQEKHKLINGVGNIAEIFERLTQAIDSLLQD